MAKRLSFGIQESVWKDDIIRANEITAKASNAHNVDHLLSHNKERPIYQAASRFEQDLMQWLRKLR